MRLAMEIVLGWLVVVALLLRGLARGWWGFKARD
jgi:hypothetical protein